MISALRLLAIWLICSLNLAISAQDGRYGIFEKTGDILPANIRLTNEDSVIVNFGDLIDKPTLLSFVYFNCPGLCSPVMDGIAEIIDKSDLRPGRDYQVITIGIDYREPISLAKAKKASYVRAMKRADAGKYWQFYVADSSAVRKITSAAGWKFRRTGNDFVHSAATILITPHRRVNQYFYGTFIIPMHFHLAVNDAKNEISDPSRIKEQKYCYNFVPHTNNSYSLMISSAGIGILVLAVILFIWLSLTPRSKQFYKDIK